MKQLMRGGLLLAMILTLAIGVPADAQEEPMDYDGRPMVVTVVSTAGGELIVRDQDGKRIRLEIAADIPTLEEDLQKGDVVKLWTEENANGEMVAHVGFSEVGVIKPSVTTNETEYPIANTTDPEAVPSETDPVVVDPELVAGNQSDERAEHADHDADSEIAARHGRPLTVTVVSVTDDGAIVRTTDGKQMRMEIADDVPHVKGDLRKGDIVKLWTERNENGELVADVQFQEIGVIKPSVATSETRHPIANSTDPEAVPSETDPVVVDPALTASTESETEAERFAYERTAEDETLGNENEWSAERDGSYNGRESLPQTASSLPLTALLGVLAVAGAFAIRFVGRVV